MGARIGAEEAIAAHEASGRQVGGDGRTLLRANAITTRLGAVVLPLGILVLVVSEIFHPSKEDPTDHPAVFREYAHSDIRTTVHLGQYFGFLLLLGGLVALYYSTLVPSRQRVRDSPPSASRRRSQRLPPTQPCRLWTA